MSTLVTILHVGVCLFLMVTVLLQSGKGGGVGAAFGAGGSQTVFGGSGGGNFLRRLTVACAAIFMLTSITLAYMASSTGSDSLRRYSEQQREYSESMKAAREEALKAGQTDTATPDQPAPEGVVPTGEQPAGTEGVVPTGEQPAEGAAPAGEQPTEGAAPAGEQPAEGAAPAGEQPAGADQGGAAAPAGQGATPNP
jgi:preprotein translocase subunit SecG